MTNGRDALDYLRGRGEFANRKAYPYPSIIFTEIKLPLRSGFDVLKWLRDHPQRPVIPTIVLSSSDLDSDIRKAYRLGCHSYLIKPATLQQLQRLLAKVYGYWRLCEKPQMA